MSQENVEIVRRAYEAYARGDLEAALADLAPNVEWHTPPGERELDLEPVYHGPEAVGAALAAWAASWDEWVVEPVEFIDAGDEVVVVLDERGRGKGSGAEVFRAHFQVVTVRNGAGILIREYTSRTEALEAAGLSE
jgi:ketosteroid isomerase-like protein